MLTFPAETMFGDLMKGDAGPQCLFGAVVCGRDRPVGDEDEQVLAEALDDAQKFLPELGAGTILSGATILVLESK